MFAKRFFYVSAAILCLAAAYHLGASTATAQAPGNPVVAAGDAAWGESWVVTANGDVFSTVQPFSDWSPRGNVFTGSPVPVQQESFGSLKARYRTPAAQGR